MNPNRLPPELARILEADLGKSYDPQKALEFLRTLQPHNRDLPAASRLNRLLENPPEEDTPLETIYETPFVRGEIVMAGKKTRKEYPRTAYYPLHFKKTYLEKFSRWETTPKHEEDMSLMVWKHFQEEGEHNKVPLALGADAKTFRSQLMQGKSIGALSPIHNGDNPKELANQIVKAKENYGPVSKLWAGLEAVHASAATLHQGGMLHHDMHRENMLISPDGDGFLIDFETMEEDDRFASLAWEDATKEDLRYLIEEAALVSFCAGPNEKLPTNTELSKLVAEAKTQSPKLLATAKEINQIQKTRESQTQSQNEMH